MTPAPSPNALWLRHTELLPRYPAASEVSAPPGAPRLQEVLSHHPGPVLNELGRGRLGLAHWAGERTSRKGFSENKPHFPSPQRAEGENQHGNPLTRLSDFAQKGQQLFSLTQSRSAEQGCVEDTARPSAKPCISHTSAGRAGSGKAQGRDGWAFLCLLRLQCWSLLGSGLQTGKTVGLIYTELPPDHKNQLTTAAGERVGDTEQQRTRHVAASSSYW